MQRFMELPGKALDKFRKFGPSRALQLIIRGVSNEYFDWKYGISTSGRIEQSKLSESEFSKDYIATDYKCLEAILGRLEIDAEQQVFLDYGCGKGRVVVLAAMRKFRRVIGVEYSPDLCSIANQNLENAKQKLTCQDIKIENIDAAEYLVPEDVSIGFLFNPFDGRVLERVHDQIVTSLQTTPRRFRVIYLFPKTKTDLFNCSDHFRLAEDLEFKNWSKFRVRIYEYVML